MSSSGSASPPREASPPLPPLPSRSPSPPRAESPEPIELVPKETPPFVNMTEDNVNIYVDGDPEHEPITIVKSGIVPSCAVKSQVQISIVNEIPIYTAPRYIVPDMNNFESYVTRDTPIIVSRKVGEVLEHVGFTWPGGIYAEDLGEDSLVFSKEGTCLGVQRLEVWIAPAGT